MLRRLYGVLSKVRRDRISPRTPPSSFTDEEGRSILVRPYRDDDFHALAAMYDDFDPSQRAQGTPPLGAEAVRDWLSTLLDGVNVVAVHDDRVVGHVTFVPDDTDRHELAIFVHQEYQRAGIGSELLACGVGHAAEEDVEYVWLSVETWKTGAQKLYGRAGFSSVNPMGATHRMSRYL
jgi:ribosomal protein S18 acetylase RimI-like enzyme